MDYYAQYTVWTEINRELFKPGDLNRVIKCIEIQYISYSWSFLLWIGNDKLKNIFFGKKVFWGGDLQKGDLLLKGLESKTLRTSCLNPFEDVSISIKLAFRFY